MDEIVACLEAVTPVTGAARVVQCAPKLALALGYDVEAALERRDPDELPVPAMKTSSDGIIEAELQAALRLPRDPHPCAFG